jgi:hypothetical protein
VSAADRPLRGDWDRSYWLPPFGYGNGLPAAAWTPLVDVDQAGADLLLAALLDAGIPAYTAPRPRRQRTGSTFTSQVYRVWVEVRMHSRAEDLARLELLRQRRRGA